MYRKYAEISSKCQFGDQLSLEKKVWMYVWLCKSNMSNSNHTVVKFLLHQDKINFQPQWQYITIKAAALSLVSGLWTQ